MGTQLRFSKAGMGLSHACFVLFLSLLTGCAAKPVVKIQPEQKNFFIEELQTYIIPPEGWTNPDIERSDDHIRYAWVSPTDSTAVGVIRFQMPLPLGYDVAVWGFMEEMKKREGTAEMIEQHWDVDTQTMRFVAEGGRFRMRVKMIVSGADGWAFFAGTKTDRPVNDDELKRAVFTRDNAKILAN